MTVKQDELISHLNELDFSDSSKQLEELKQIIFNAVETNEAKIKFIKEEILANKYQIQNTLIAEKMLEYVPTQALETELA